MDFFRRIFTNKQASGDANALDTFPIHFPNGNTPRAVRVPAEFAPAGGDYDRVIHALQLTSPAPTIFISGGAGMMDTGSLTNTRSTIEDGLVRFLEERRINLIDGGTASGVMGLIGNARQRRGYSFPLIGVAPERMIGYPGYDNPNKTADLDAYHSHFLLTSGDRFGSESEQIIAFAYALSGYGDRKRLVIVLNGGEIVKQEAHRCSTREPRFPLLVLEGSGRFADELSASRRTGSSDPLIKAILDQGIVHFIPIKAGADNLRRWLENFFGTE